MTKEARHLQVVEVGWVDSYADWTWGDWGDAASIKVAENLTVGFLVSEDDEFIRIGTSYDSSHDNLAGLTVIPKVAITRRRVIEAGDSGAKAEDAERFHCPEPTCPGNYDTPAARDEHAHSYGHASSAP